MLEYKTLTPLKLKTHPQFNEKWVQEKIAADPSLLGLGDLELKDMERIQPKAGRLDLLLRDPETDKRYEVELMLGALDESHIIRTLEYWDIERKRYPQYDHVAVVVAEDVTSRFLNVLGLFNSAIPIIALQMTAYQFNDNVFLTFTKVLDEVVRGDDDEVEPLGADLTDRAYWDKRAPSESLKLMDECLLLLKEIKSDFELQYRKYYVGILESGITNNFIVFRPLKSYLRIEARVTDMETWKLKLEEAGLTLMSHRNNKIRIRVNQNEMKGHRDTLKELFSTAYHEQMD